MSAGLLVLFLFETSYACPAALFGHEILPKLAGIRQNLQLFVAKAGTANSPVRWINIPYQVDLVDEAGHIAFTEKKFMEESLSYSDLVMFNTGEFGERVINPLQKIPCKAKSLVELKDKISGRFGYLVQCNSYGNSSYPQIVTFDSNKSTLKSRFYVYEFNPKNYMQFNKIKINDNLNEYLEVARDSKLVITSDVKNFFTLHFDSRQIESNLEKSRLGPVANLARLSFFLRILFFKLDMSLSTDVAFFEDSGHIPMMINLPVDSFRFLNPKSGILYTWTLPRGIDHKGFSIKMPSIDPEITGKGWSELGEIGGKYCSSNICKFSFTSSNGVRSLTMKMEIANHLVKKGFFPQFVPDVAQYKDEMDWEIDIENGVHRVGMYFEFSGLPKGGHPWSFWLKMSQGKNEDYQCPRRIVLNSL